MQEIRGVGFRRSDRGGSDSPTMTAARNDALLELRSWLFNRIWPGRYPELEAAMRNFSRVLADFQETFLQYAKPQGNKGELLQTEKFYQIPEWDPPRYDLLVCRFDKHVDLLQNLMLELTRAANYICDYVRKYIELTFRHNEGVLLVESGPYAILSPIGLSSILHRAEYRAEERTEAPYPGLEQFKTVSLCRDYCFGRDASSD